MICRKIKITKREKMMALDYVDHHHTVTDNLEKETNNYICEFNSVLSSSHDTIQEYHNVCSQNANNSEWNQRINEMRSKIKEFNKQRKNNRDLNFNLSNKKLNSLIHSEYTETLNLLSAIIHECTCIIKILQENMFKQNSMIPDDPLFASNQRQTRMSLNDRSIQCQYYSSLQTVTFLTNQVLKAIKIIMKNNSLVSLSMNNPEDFLDNILLLMLQWNGWTGEVEKKIFKNSIIVIEACLVSKSFVFNANNLKYMNVFMENVQHRELSQFLRVLALFVLEVIDKQKYKAISKGGGMNYINNHILMNHSLLASQPLFLRKVFDIAESMIVVISSLMECRQETQLRETIEHLDKTKSLECSGICLNELITNFFQKEFSARYRNLLNKRFMIEYCLKNSSLMELLFILQNLLTGRKKTIVQNELNRLDFIDKILSPFFDILFHKEFNLEDIVSEEDEDTQDICFTARIQLLRLIINFTDRDEDNHVIKSKLISTSEHFYLQNLEFPLLLYLHQTTSPYSSPQNTPPESSTSLHSEYENSPLFRSGMNRTEKVSSPCKIANRNTILDSSRFSKVVEIDGIEKYRTLIEQCDGQDILSQEYYLEGVLSEVTKKKFDELYQPSTVTKKNTVDYKKDRLHYVEQSDRGLMHKIIETLKSINENCQVRFWLGSCVEVFLKGSHWYYQNFTFCTGLTYTLIKQFILNRLSKTNNIQITLDILAESVKFNQLNIMYLNTLLVEEDWIKKIESKMFGSIVDTNVFLRNLYLTYELTEFQRGILPRKPFTALNKDQNLFKILCESNMTRTIIELIKSVNEDNLNQENISCINSVLIIFIFDHVKGHLHQTFEKIVKNFAGQETLNIFQKVINVWLNYHQVKNRELYSLEYSTKIPHYYFKLVIEQFNIFISKQEEQLKIN